MRATPGARYARPMSGTPDLATLAADPAWFAHRYDPAMDHVHLLHLTRADHRAATFLTDEHLPKDARLAVQPRAELVAAAPPPAPAHFIFHSAYCGSSVLARAFDLPGVAMGLKEPPIFNDLVGWRRRGGDPKRVAMVLDQGIGLLARPFAAGEAVVIKPSNVINSLAGAILTMRKDARALLLHAPLRTYLISVAKKGMWGRWWVRELLVGLLKEGAMPLAFDTQQLLGQTDLQAAAVGWLSQQAIFAGLAGRLGASRVRTLDSETLLARPHEVMAALATLYALPLDTAAIDAIVAGPAFTRHSKSGEAFGRQARAREYDDAGAIHGEEIDKVARWAEVVAEGAGIPLALPAPLIG